MACNNASHDADSGENAGLNGKWMMYKVIQEGKDVSKEHNPFEERFFVLKNDSTFESDGRPYGRNTGKYVYNQEENSLFIDSDVGPEDDSRWKITLLGDTMKWRGVGTQWAEQFEIIHVRAK